MKTRNLVILALFSIFLFACNTTKKGAVSCPDISVKKSRYSVNHRKSQLNLLIVSNRNKPNHSNKSKKLQLKPEPGSPAIVQINKAGNYEIGKPDVRGMIASTNNMIYTPIEFTEDQNSNDVNTIEIQTGSQTIQGESEAQECDTIFLKSGGTLIGRVEEIGQTEIKYRKCNNLTGPVISVIKSEISSIKYVNGTIDYFGPSDNPVPVQTVNYPRSTDPVKTEGLGIAGFVSSLVGLFIAGVLLGIIGIVFGGVSLSKIKNNPGRYKGRGLAVAAIIIGIISAVGAIIVMGAL
ncbi:MAG TPA: DUF4190 domain-containing protein [Bacteroidales bacterium]|nr:DUF4190 domain-containing protein [Bacteroidales bacterium]